MAVGEGLIYHFGAIRMRVTGSGDLLLTLLSVDNVRELELTSFALDFSSNKEPTRLCNFTEERVALKFEVDAYDEYFELSKIVIFAKGMASNYPG